MSNATSSPPNDQRLVILSRRAHSGAGFRVARPADCSLARSCLAPAGWLARFWVHRLLPGEGDAGWTARSYAEAIGKQLDQGQSEEIPLILRLVKGRALTLPISDKAGAGVPRYYINTSQDVIDRLTGVSVLDASGNILGESGSPTAREQYQSTWAELVQLALSGEKNPYTLSRFLSLSDSGLLLGSAAIRRASGEIAGVVIVEMHPSLRLETSTGVLARLVGFFGIWLTTSIIGFSILELASLLAIISSLVVSRILGRRLKTLEDTAQSMAGGNLSLRVPVDSPDEIGQVGQAFNQWLSSSNPRSRRWRRRNSKLKTYSKIGASW